MYKECSPKRAARVARMEAQAERLGQLQNFLSVGIFNPSTVAAVAITGGVVAVGWIENLAL